MVYVHMMKSIAKHSIAFGRVLTLVFLLVSSRFTTFLHMCVREASECCCVTSGARIHDARLDKTLPIAGMSIYNGGGRQARVVVGRMRVVLALVEKDSKEQNVEVLSLLTSSFVSPAPGKTSAWFNYSYFESVSPPSVEKYVLNATLLI
jgi:hypothetical protein